MKEFLSQLIDTFSSNQKIKKMLYASFESFIASPRVDQENIIFCRMKETKEKHYPILYVKS